MLKEFSKFIARGNVVDLAVAVIIGAAFTGIVNSVVQDLITPVLGLLGERNFSDFYLVVKGDVPPGVPYQAAKSMAVVVGYGAFLTAVINFTLIAVVVFGLVQVVHRLQRKEVEQPPKAPEETKTEKLLAEIRDALKARQ